MAGEENKEFNEILKYWDNNFQLGVRKLLTEILGNKPLKEEIKKWDDKKLDFIKDKWNEFILQSQIYISRLLKAENLTFLFGAGPSIALGGITIKNLPLILEYQVQNSLADQREKLRLFYRILGHIVGSKPFSQDNIEKRIEKIKDLMNKGNTDEMKKEEITVPLEHFLSYMYSLKTALINPLNKENESISKIKLSIIKEDKEIDLSLTNLDDLIKIIKTEYFSILSGIPEKSMKRPFAIHKQFFKKILTRPLNLRRPQIFTTNNDLMIENALDELGIMYLDGFIGTTRRFFRPESYNYDFYFPSTSTEGKVHRVDQVIHFYKIHGSINWLKSFDSPGDIYGIEAKDIMSIMNENRHGDVMIYPTPLKNEFTLDFPYSELLRRFADAITQPQSVLITIGYSFADEHVNRIIYQALTIPSFTLLVVDPLADENKEISRLLELEDSRIYVISGWNIGSFDAFTKRLLPDIKELEVHEKSAQSARRMLRIEENHSKDSLEEEE